MRAAVLLAALSFGQEPPKEVPQALLAYQPMRFDGQVVTVSGIVDKPRYKHFDATDSALWEFDLRKDDSRRSYWIAVRFYTQTWGERYARFPFNHGDAVVLTGKFWKMRDRRQTWDRTMWIGHLDVNWEQEEALRKRGRKRAGPAESRRREERRPSPAPRRREAEAPEDEGAWAIFAKDPTSIHEKLVTITGYVRKLDVHHMEKYDTTYYNFDLCEDASRDPFYVRVKYLSRERGKDVLKWPGWREGDKVRVRGLFRRYAMSKVTKYIGNVEVSPPK